MRYIISFLLASTATTAFAEVPRVVTDLLPVHALTAQVMGDLGSPDLLLDRGADAHSFQLRPSQAASLADANLIVWIGPEMTPWLTRALDSLSPDVARLPLLSAKGTFTRSFGDTAAHDHGAHEDHGTEAADDHAGHDHEAEAELDHTGHDHEAEAADDHAGHGHEAEAADSHADHDYKTEAAESHEGHDHSGLDPHAWLDPANARLWLELIADELSRLDPDNAATYAANAAAAQTGIDALDAEIKATLAPAEGKPFVVFHDAYGYFAGHYGLTIAGAVALGDASSPGAARLRELTETVASGGAVCLFPETQHDPALVTQMAEGSSARIGAPLDPEGSAIEPGPGAYAILMRSLATSIAACVTG